MQEGLQETHLADPISSVSTISYGVVTVAGPNGGGLVQEVEMFSSASQAGVQKGDEILALDQEPFRSHEIALAQLESLGAGKVVSLRLRRGDEDLVLPMELFGAAILDLDIEETDDVLERRIAP